MTHFDRVDQGLSCQWNVRK